MQIKIKKKKGILMFMLFFLLICIAVSLYFIKIEIEEPYKNLFTYCTQKDYENRSLQECKVFLDDFYEYNNQNCLKIVVPESDSSKRNIELCFNNRISMNWVNPYENYDLNIPVIIKIDYKTFPIINVKDIDVELMSDQEAHNLVDSINQEGDKLILYRNAEATKKIKEKGYYLVTRICDISTEGVCTALGIYEVKVQDYYLEGEELVFKLKIPILGQEIEKVVRSDQFQYEEYSYSNIQAPLKKEMVDINSEFEDLFSKGEDYVMEFTIVNYNPITDKLIEQYSKGLIDLEIKLERVIHYVK